MLGKLLSARWLVTILVVLTYCACVIMKYQVSAEFQTLAMAVVMFYFARNDRKGESK